MFDELYILFHFNIILYRKTAGTLTAFLKHAAQAAFFFPQNAMYFIIFICFGSYDIHVAYRRSTPGL